MESLLMEKHDPIFNLLNIGHVFANVQILGSQPFPFNFILS